MTWLKQIAIALKKWRHPLLTIEVPEPFAGSNNPNFKPISKSPECWCGHYARSHTQDIAMRCMVVDCPCEKLMDPSVVVCTRCLQLHAVEAACKLPGTPQVVDGISQGVLVNFKPSRKAND